MTHPRRLAVVAALFLGVAVLGEVAQAGWWDDAGAARRASIAELRKDPDRWRDVTVTIDVRFARLAEPGTPFFTRFTAREWRAVTVEIAGDAAEEGAKPAEPFSRIFVRRGSDGERRLSTLAAGGRAQLRAAVRDAVKGEPWIEVFDVVADGDPLTPEEASVVARADELLAHESPAAAEDLLRELMAKRALSKPVQAELWRKVGAACWAQKHVPQAAAAYDAALAADPKDEAAAEKFAVAKAAMAASTKTVAATGAASVAASGPTPPASMGTPVVPAPTRRLLPPVGIPDAAGPAKAPPAAEPVAPPQTDPAPVEPPATDAPAPPPPPKPKLAGPK